ncbi:SagB/ThcOx family dehydrogenase [Microbacterium sp. G2-8]|uniref:SagB/ThcOx family dehydrogenase n=1 Tax=Microbacterium sp. G2-8 TaxID=2842454 RepID=UPI001C8A844A|nr:SagB/ThcOx family dehydrogenase [Microbacterium sp. G2-8]
MTASRIRLPDGPAASFAAAVAARRSTKTFRADPLPLDLLAAALRHAASRTEARPHASARARYLVGTTIIAGEVDGLTRGAYRYDAASHELAPTRSGDVRRSLADATIDAAWLARCPAIIALSADPARADAGFEELDRGQGERFAWFEAGMIAQTLHLWAADAGLGTAVIGGFDSAAMPQAADGLVPEGHRILALLPLGFAADKGQRRF